MIWYMYIGSCMGVELGYIGLGLTDKQQNRLINFFNNPRPRRLLTSPDITHLGIAVTRHMIRNNPEMDHASLFAGVSGTVLNQ